VALMKHTYGTASQTGTPVQTPVKHRGWGWRFLKNKKVVNGILYQLHATRGWKKIGKAEAHP
jgi:hypothetical protein